MFISVEGTDASGKTTLTDAIAKHLSDAPAEIRVDRYHKGAPQELTRAWVLNDYVESIASSSWQDAHAVADRWHWGEITYAPLKRPNTSTEGYGLLGQAGWRWVELFMLSRGMTQFWLHQPLDVITRRLSERGDDFVEPHELEHILRLYETAYAHTAACTKITPPDDSSDAAIQDTVNTIIEIAQARTDSVRHLTRHKFYIGPARPKALLVGDERNDETDTFLPFKPTNVNSGDYLLNALPDETWSQFGIINSADVYGEDIIRLYEDLGKPRVIALGRMAEKRLRACTMYEDTYVVLPHPQHVRRFHYRDQHEYGRAIDSFASGNTQEYASWILR
jgi:thymidylate kinase